jgi:hypothetical protein
MEKSLVLTFKSCPFFPHIKVVEVSMLFSLVHSFCYVHKGFLVWCNLEIKITTENNG